jgi:hypothetical protein
VQVCTFKNMDDATVDLINKEFVPLVSIAWGFGEVLTARGEVIAPRLVTADTGGPNGANNPFAPKRLHAASEKFKQLPPEKRTATIAELPSMWKGKAEPNPPAEGLILKQYRRGFHRDANGTVHRRELHHDSLWMTKAEWQSLVPEQPRVGDSMTVPEFLVNRIGRHHAQIVNPSTSLKISATPKPVLTLTVEDASPDQVRFRLHGSFLVTEYQPEPGGALTNGIIDYQVCGCLQYDVKKKAFSRFDLAAVGDVTNIRKDCVPPKGRTMVSGLLFELSPGVTPYERTPPYARVASGVGEAVYFKAGK